MPVSQEQSQDEFIPVNQVLNLKPRLGPVPGEQVIPWSVIFFVSYIFCQGMLGMSWLATGLVAAWGVGTWWCVTGDASWRFLTKFTGVPVWTRGNLTYTGLMEPAPTAKKTKKRSGRKPARSKRTRRRNIN